jgi:beta-galactosidase
MNKITLFLSFLLAFAACSGGSSALCGPDVPHRQQSLKPFGRGWQFSLDGAPERTVDIPHDWGVEGPFEQEYPGETGKLRWWGKAQYRKTLHIPAGYGDHRFCLEIDGAMSGSQVYANGVLCGGWPYGYSSYEVDLTEALHSGDNEILITLDNPPESSRWYPGGGIYRNIWIAEKPSAGVAHWGTSLTTRVDGSDAEVQLRIKLRNSGAPLPATVETWLCDASRTQLSEAVSSKIGSLEDGMEVVQTLPVRNARLWSPDSPELYCAVTRVETAAGAEVYTTYFGIRTAEFRPDGFYLNGGKTFLKGVCLHHDAGALGAAWHEDAWVRRLLKLKEMGCNAIRMSHNPPAPELLDLCDCMGFIVIDELTDTWTVPKKPNGYATLFDEWAEKDLVAMIHRDRNHPSVVMWSIGNEVGEQGLPDKWDVARRLTEICHREDPSRPTTAGNDNLWAASQPWASTIDVYGFNYKPHAYEAFRDSHPGQPFYGSETASCISTRGYYLFPVVDEKDKGWLDGAPYQVSSYDLYAPAWASKPDYEWKYEDEVPECAGEFVWTGYDYLGEPTPYNLDPSVLTNFHTEEEKQAAIAQFAAWGQKVLMEPLPSRSSYFGIMDLAGFPKDRFWLYQARWRPDLAVAHIVPHWTWPGREGEVTPVHVYGSGAVGELFLNGKSLGVREKAGGEYRLRWDDAVYEPGTLEVRVYRDRADFESGKVLCTDSVSTAGAPESVKLSQDYVGAELIYVRAEVQDAKGRLVPDANDHIAFSVSGPAEIIATDAGDPTSHAPFCSPSVDAFHGLASAVLRRTGPGRVVVKASSASLRPSKLSIF